MGEKHGIGVLDGFAGFCSGGLVGRSPSPFFSCCMFFFFSYSILAFPLVIQIGLLRSDASPLTLSFRLLGLRIICSAAAYGKAVRHSVWRRFGGQEPGGGVGRDTTEQGGRSAHGAFLLDYFRSEMETGENLPWRHFWIAGTGGMRGNTDSEPWEMGGTRVLSLSLID